MKLMNQGGFQTTIRVLQIFSSTVKSCFQQLETLILNKEDDEVANINKKMVLVLWYNILFYYVAISFFNTQTPTSVVTMFLGIGVLQFFVLRIKNYKIMAWFFIMCSIFSISVSSFAEINSLRALAVSLAQHNYSLVLPNSLMLRVIYIVTNFFILQRPRNNILALIEEGNFAKLEITFQNFCFAWPLLYIINHCVVTYLVRSYQKAIENYKEVQKKLASTNQQLQDANEKLKEALSLLEKTNQDLEASLKARELFIASVSHELRNPLNVMIGNIELLGLDPLSPKQLQMLSTCKICGEVLLSLINNVLDVAKINAQKLELNYLPGDFCQLVEKIWDVSVMKISQKELSGTLHIERDFPKYIEMDSHRITQVLLNILGNASKFTNKGFIKVFISWHDHESIQDLKKPHPEYLRLLSESSNSTRYTPLERLSTEDDEMTRLDSQDFSSIQLPKTIKISQRFSSSKILLPYSEHETYKSLSMVQGKSRLPLIGNFGTMSLRKKEGLIRINIIDTGCGISGVALSRIFLPFEQADSSITRQFGGTGLGLYITQQIIHQMGGEIFVHSKEHVGTNFVVIFPAKIVNENEVKKKDSETKTANTCKAQLKALVVDDSPHNQLIICSFLTKLNIHCDIANNGKEAIELFLKNGYGYYTLITMDLQMPIMDGLAACKKIRQLETQLRVSSPTPIIVITGNCTNQEKSECLNPLGDIRAKYFFRKSFTFDECKNAVQSIIEHKEVGSKIKKSKILIVDDDPFNQKVIYDYLVKYGFICDTCSNGEQVLQKLSQETFDVVLLDCEMPQMDGYTAARLIKSSYPYIRIIGITGHTESKYIQKALESGMKDVETKPVNFKRLCNLILDTYPQMSYFI